MINDVEVGNIESSFVNLSWEVEKAKNKAEEEMEELKQLKNEKTAIAQKGEIGKGNKGSIVIGRGTLGKGSLKGTLTKKYDSIANNNDEASTSKSIT